MTAARLCGRSARDCTPLLAAAVVLGAVVCCSWLCPFGELSISQSLSLIGHRKSENTQQRSGFDEETLYKLAPSNPAVTFHLTGVYNN